MIPALVRSGQWCSVRLAIITILAGGVGACRESSVSPALSAPTPLVAAIARPEMRRGDFWEYEVSGGEAPTRWAIEVDEVLPGGRFRARVADGVAPIGTIGQGAQVRRVEFDGPWNTVQADPDWMLKYLQFPLTDGARWTSTATGPGAMTRTLTQEVKGMQALQIAGASFACARIEGSEATTVSGPPSVTVLSQSTLWYCPALRAVGRVETQVTGAPHVTQELVVVRAAQ